MQKGDKEGLVNQPDRKMGTALRNVIKVKNRGGGGAHLKEQYSAKQHNSFNISVTI